MGCDKSGLGGRERFPVHGRALGREPASTLRGRAWQTGTRNVSSASAEKWHSCGEGWGVLSTIVSGVFLDYVGAIGRKWSKPAFPECPHVPGQAKCFYSRH